MEGKIFTLKAEAAKKTSRNFLKDKKVLSRKLNKIFLAPARKNEIRSSEVVKEGRSRMNKPTT